MELSGLTMRIQAGPFEVYRAPRIVISSVRHTPMCSIVVALSDPAGAMAGRISAGDALTVELAYRGQAPATWTGRIVSTRAQNRDQVEIRATRSADLPLDTKIRQSWADESPEAIIRWSAGQAGLAVGRIDSPGIVIPRFAAASIPVWAVARSAACTVQRACDIDMSRWALWVGPTGRLNWGDFDEPDTVAVPVVATGAGLIRHYQDSTAKGLFTLETFLLPDLTHSRSVRIQDAVRGSNALVRALAVRHEVEPSRARTFISYGVEHGRY